MTVACRADPKQAVWVLRCCWRGETAEPDRSRQNASLAQRGGGVVTALTTQIVLAADLDRLGVDTVRMFGDVRDPEGRQR